MHPSAGCCHGPEQKRTPDFKQLPLASSEAPFIVLSCVRETFDFRCFRQNRRVVKAQGDEAELENLHQVLSDISIGVASNEVRQFVVEARR